MPELEELQDEPRALLPLRRSVDRQHAAQQNPSAEISIATPNVAGVLAFAVVGIVRQFLAAKRSAPNFKQTRRANR
jgi:hypothetical protein